MSDHSLVTVYTSQGILGAEVVKAKLVAAGIPALLRYESAGLVLGLTVDGLGLVEVQVPESMAEEAECLVAEDLYSSPDEDDDQADAPAEGE